MTIAEAIIKIELTVKLETPSSDEERANKVMIKGNSFIIIAFN